MIWYCGKLADQTPMCGEGHFGWVIGLKGKATSGYFSEYERWNGYRIYMREDSNSF